ncbi:hypothetical protein LINPERHAP2_LOCUS4357, partial [Linum perenne]
LKVLVYHQRQSSFVCGTNSTEYLGFLGRYLVDFKVLRRFHKLGSRGADK